MSNKIMEQNIYYNIFKSDNDVKHIKKLCNCIKSQ